MRMVKTQNEVENDFREDAEEMEISEITLEEQSEDAMNNELEDEEYEDDFNETMEEEIDLTEFTPSICKQKSRSFGESGVMSIIHSSNGMRVSLSKDLMEQLGNPSTVQFGLSDNQIAIAENLGSDFTSYPLSKSGAKKSNL